MVCKHTHWAELLIFDFGVNVLVFAEDEMKHKMSCCRLSLVIVAVLYMFLNMLFLWFSMPGPVAPCDCRCDALKHQPTLTNNNSHVHFQNVSSLSIVSDTVRSNTASHVTTISGQVATEASTIHAPASQAQDVSWEPHHLAVVVPFRNRYEEMMEFVPHIHQFLTRQQVHHQIWVINQADKHRYDKQPYLHI